MTQVPIEVLVIGGGPAGASAARLLAAWGHRVRLVTRAAGEARLAESLPPSCGKLFDAIDVSTAIERVGFIRSTGNTVWWGSDTPRVEQFADGGRGWQVEAEALAAVLLDEAVRSGAHLERRVFHVGEGASNQPPLKLRRSAEARRAKAEDAPLLVDRGVDRSGGSLDPPFPFVLDCSGRSGVVARALGLRQYDEGPRTIALVASWRSDRDWNVPDASHTVVESYEGGWAWSVPTSANHRHIAVMVDPERSGLARGGSARDIYLAEVAKTREFRSLVNAAALADGPWGWDASTYHARRYTGDRWLLVGDAGSFIDPLSSAGVKKALASGWLAAVVAHTWLTKPEMREDALRFFEERETEIHQQFTAMTRRLLADAAAGHAHRFWADRWDERQDTAADAADEVRVQDAFERLRSASAFHVRRGLGVVMEARPAVSGREIVLEPRIVTRETAAGVRFVHDVDVISVIDLAPHHSDVGGLFEVYCRTSGPVALPAFLHALATALARGWLVAE